MKIVDYKYLKGKFNYCQNVSWGDVINKIDLVKIKDETFLNSQNSIITSALNGEGINDLKEKLYEMIFK